LKLRLDLRVFDSEEETPIKFKELHVVKSQKILLQTCVGYCHLNTKLVSERSRTQDRIRAVSVATLMQVRNVQALGLISRAIYLAQAKASADRLCGLVV
jgi:hypothetical protein